MGAHPQTAVRGDRRARITGAVIELVAAKGVRAVTHRAVDRTLDLPAGSTSYYFRTRRALLEATVRELAARARDDFAASRLRPPTPGTQVEEVAAAIGAYVDTVAAVRRAEVLARHALTLEVAQDPELRSMLVPGPFSVDAAAGLMTALGADEPELAAGGLVSLLEGLLLERATGSRQGTTARPGAAQQGAALPVGIYLRGAVGPSSRPDGSSGSADAVSAGLE